MDIPRNAFKHAVAAGQLQIGLWCSLCSNIAAEIVARRRLRLDAARHRAFAQRASRPARPVAGDARRHRDAGRAAGLERHGADQAHPRHRRADAAGSLCAERGRSPARGGGGALSAARRARRRGREPRQPLRPGHRLSARRPTARSACWCRWKPGRHWSSSKRSPRSTASTACSSARPTCPPRWAISAIRRIPSRRRRCRTPRRGSRSSARRPAS